MILLVNARYWNGGVTSPARDVIKFTHESIIPRTTAVQHRSYEHYKQLAPKILAYGRL